MSTRRARDALKIKERAHEAWRCASPDVALSKLAARPGTNLLDNWYFGNPVNQRGQTEYPETYGYSIDRWIHAGTEGATMSVVPGSPGHITINRNSPMIQYLDPNLPVEGMELTFSLLTAEGTLHTATFTWSSDLTDNTGGGVFTSTSYVFGYGKYGGINQVSFGGADAASGAHNILAVKLECGPTQTLAHKVGAKWELNEIPDYTLEYLSCCRYQYAPPRADGRQGYIGPFWTNGYRKGDSTPIYGTVTIPVPMQKAPTVVYTADSLTHILYWNPGGTPGAVTALSVYGMTNGDIQLCATIGAQLTPGPAGLIYFGSPTESLLLFDANL